jgi:hypothetical protein
MEWAVSDPCDICAKNDGQVIQIGQSFASGDQQPPAHPHCRCVLLPVIPGMEDDDPMGIDGGLAPMPDGAPVVEEPVSTQYVAAKNSFDHFTPEKAESFYAVSADGQINYNSYNVKGQNLYLKNLLEEQGFNGKPQIVTAKEFKKYVDEGATPIYRGIAGDTAEDVNSYVSQLLEGDSPFIGKGMFGDGTYFASNREIAEAFTKETVIGEARNTGRVVEAVLNPQAKVITLQELRLLEDQKWPSGHGDYPQDFYEDPGAIAAALGYDAIKMERPKLSWTPDAKPVDADYIVVLNRTALIFKEMP